MAKLKAFAGLACFLILTVHSVDAQARGEIVQARLLSPISSKANRAGDKFALVVLLPPVYKDGIIEGHIIEAKGSGRVKGKSQLLLAFDSLTLGTRTIPIVGELRSVKNSKGAENVDEEGRVVGRGSKGKDWATILALGAAGTGIGWITGGREGAIRGGAAGVTVGTTIILTTKGPEIELATGGELTLALFRRVERSDHNASGSEDSSVLDSRRATSSSLQLNPPSEQFELFENRLVRMMHPTNWHPSGQHFPTTFAPEGGIVHDRRGNAALAYGVLMDLSERISKNYGWQELNDATHQLIEQLRLANPRMRIFRGPDQVRIGDSLGLSVYLRNDSPIGGAEFDRLVTLQRPEGMVYLICAAPESRFQEYERAFERMLDSLVFR